MKLPTTSGSTPDAEPDTLAQMLDKLGGELIDELEPVSQLGRDALREAEGEIRRGLLAMNGAGLVAVISLLTATLDASVVHIAAALYFVGLVAGGVSWWFRVAGTNSIAVAHSGIRRVIEELKTHPKLMQRPSSIAEVDEMVAIANVALTRFRDQTGSSTTWSRRFTYLAIATFLLSSTSLLADYEWRFLILP